MHEAVGGDLHAFRENLVAELFRDALRNKRNASSVVGSATNPAIFSRGREVSSWS